MSAEFAQIVDPLELGKILWPWHRSCKECGISVKCQYHSQHNGIMFAGYQRDIVRSVEWNDETFVPAGNMLGKDFIAGFVAIAFFMTREPCRVITTSVDATQLAGVLWGEIRRFIQTSKYPLEHEKGGPLVVNHMHIRKVINFKTMEMCPLSYLIGRVAAKGEGMLGHHIAKTGDGIPRTLYIGDEASGLEDASFEAADTWADRKLIIGNPYPCQTFFKKGVKAGDLVARY